MCHHVMGWRRVDDGVEMRGKVQEPSRRRLGQSDRDQESSNAGNRAAPAGERYGVSGTHGSYRAAWRRRYGVCVAGTRPGSHTRGRGRH